MFIKMTIEKHLFRLDVRIEKLPPMKIDVIDTVTAGRDPRCDLTLSGEKIKNRHFVFMQKGENLALHYLGNTNQAFLNSLPLEEDKVYLLEPGDKIALTGVEIIVKHELVHVPEGHHTVKPIIFNSLDDLKPETIKEGLIFKDNPTGSLREQKHIQPPLLKAPPKKDKNPTLPTGSFLNLWAVKIYAMVADIFFTYLILVVAIPLIPMVTAETIVLKILNFFSSLIFLTGRHSFIKFLIAWYFLSFAQTMIFGTTISQFLLGLRNKNDKTYGRLILFRMKTFLFSLFLLPAQNMVSQKLFFKGIRKGGMIIIMGFILASPLFLPPPFNKSVTLMKDVTAYERELRTKTITSFSATLKMNLKTDLSTRYLLLPVIYKSADMRAFEFFDLETNQSIVIYQDKKISYDDLDRELEYANPLYDFFHTTTLTNMALRNRKEVIANALLISPEHLKSTLPKSGPFFGSQVLLKEHLLDSASSNETVLKTYAPETPVMFVAGTQQDYFYLFSPDGIDRFVIENPGRGAMVSVFENEVMTKFLSDPDIIDIKGNPRSEILEAQDAFLHGEEGPLLTYYINVANSLSNLKVVHNDKDLTGEAKRAVIKNIESVQKFIKVKNNYKSFDDIKNQLTPMENPGVKR